MTFINQSASFRRVAHWLFARLLPVLILSLHSAHSAHANGVVSTLGNGQIVTGTVTTTGFDTYSIYVPAGGSLLATVAEVGVHTFDPQIIIYNPAGTAVGNTYDSYNVGLLYSPAATGGTYTIKIQVWQAGAGGNYSLTAVTAPGTGALSSGGGMMFPSAVYNNTVYRGSIDVYNVNAIAGTGHVLTFNITRNSGTFDEDVIVLKPDGTKAFAGSEYGGTFSFSITGTNVVNGTYTVWVARWLEGDGTNTYSISASGTGVGLPTSAKADGAFCEQCYLQAQAKARAATGGVAAGDPINVATGDLYESVTDYTTAGANPLALTRSYNSYSVNRNLYPTLMGPNWRTNYDRYLQLVSSTQTAAQRPDGSVVNFTLVGTTWTPDTDQDYTLTNSGTTWTLTGPDDTVETYTGASGKGTLNTIKLRNGYTQTLNYTSGVLTSVSDSYGRALNFTYTSGVVTGMTTPDTLAFTYGYTATGGQQLLTSVGYNTSPATSITYLYENTAYPYALTGVKDELTNRYATWAYDGQGRAISSKLGDTLGANYTQVAYDDTTGNRTVTGPLGIAETYKFTTLQSVPKLSEIDRAANGTVAAATRTFGYDSNGYLNASTDWDTNSTTYVNNSHGDPTTINEAVGSSVARTTTITYDTTWVHLPHITVTPGVTETDNYDATTGNLLTKVLADTTTQTIPYSTNGQTRTWTYTYTATGQLHTAQLPRTDVTAKTTYNYTGGVLTSVVDALSHTTTVNTYLGGGLPTKITDANSVVTNLAYDGRLKLHTSGVVTSAGTLTTTFDHDAAENLTKVTLPDASYLMYGYDNAHRLQTITNALGETENFTLNAMGESTQTLWKTGGGSPTTKRQHNATFDALGRMLTDVGGMSQTTTYGYDSMGNTTSIQTPLTWTTGQAFDALNRLKTVTDPYTHTTNYTYDAHDRPLTVQDPDTNTTTYVYDGFGDRIQTASPDAGTWVYYFDADSNLSSQTDAASVVTNQTFDALDRILTRMYPADTAENVAFTYDQTTGHGKGVGRLTGLTDAPGSLSLSYDERGNELTNARTISSTAYTTTYTYDNASRIASIAYPTAGWIATYARDAAGQVSSVTTTQPSHAAVNLVTSATHLPFGPLNAFSWGNGVTDARTFDLDYRMTNLVDTATAANQNLTYGWDADNNLHTITDAVAAANSQTLGYDELERLTSAVSGTGGYGSLSYTYDNNGNRKTDGATAYTIASTSNHVTAVGATAIGYTATGNINAIGANGMTYNKANQLATATVSSTTSTYTYDAFGQRLEAKVGSSTTSIESHDQSGNMLTETNGGVETDYVYLDGQPIAAIQPAAATISYIQPDHLGTPQRVTNASKTTVWTGNYQPFGTVTPTTTITMNLRLPGQYADATGYNHNGFRDYNPAFGRYLESDPMGLEGGLNTYSYVENNPSKWRDISGLQLSLVVDACLEFPAACATAAVGAAGAASAATHAVANSSQNNSSSTQSTTAATQQDSSSGVTPQTLQNKSAEESDDPDCQDKLPTGSKGIDQTPWSGDHKDIKDGVGAGPSDKVWIDPSGNVWTQNSDGSYENHGPAGNFTGSGEPSGQTGDERDDWW